MTANPLKHAPVGGPIIATVGAQSLETANALCTATLAAPTASQMLALTKVVITSTGATAAACTTFQITGLNTLQITAGVVNMKFGVPAGAGVPAAPLVLDFNPPLLGAPGTAIGTSLGALGSGHVGATITLIAEVTRAT